MKIGGFLLKSIQINYDKENFKLRFILGILVQAQVVQHGNMFVQLSDSSKSNKIKKDVPTLTGYFYFDSNGVKYPIYVSFNKRCFIMKITKNGKMRRQYFPEITKKLYGRSTEASK